MSWQEFTALLALAAAMSFTPGPNTTLGTAIAANRGLLHAMRFVFSVPVGWGLLLLLCAVGAGALVAALPPLKWALQAIGVSYLWWLAWRLAHSATPGHVDETRLKVGFWQGVALQFLNIKVWLLALSIASGWIAGRADASSRLIVALLVIQFFAFSSNLVYASLGALLRRYLARGQRLLYFNRLMAAVLLLTSVWMLTV